MQLKEFKESAVYSSADEIVMYDKEGNEVTEVQDNVEVLFHGTLIGDGVATLEIYLDK